MKTHLLSLAALISLIAVACDTAERGGIIHPAFVIEEAVVFPLRWEASFEADGNKGSLHSVERYIYVLPAWQEGCWFCTNIADVELDVEGVFGLVTADAEVVGIRGCKISGVLRSEKLAMKEVCPEYSIARDREAKACTEGLVDFVAVELMRRVFARGVELEYGYPGDPVGGVVFTPDVGSGAAPEESYSGYPPEPPTPYPPPQ